MFSSSDQGMTNPKIATSIELYKTCISKRLLAPVAPTTNNIIFQKLYSEFEMHGMEPDKLNSQHWQLVEQRMQTEEAACVLCQGEQGGNENG